MADNNYPHPSMPDCASFESQDSFELSDFFELSDWIGEDPAASLPSCVQAGAESNPTAYLTNEIVHGDSSSGIGISSSCFQGGDSSGTGKEKKEIKEKVAFKTKSEVEVLDDGFKWRKYGKKKVKNSPNPRNYYRCSVEGCPVKKRVERDKEDPRYVVTTYEGIHNHMGPPI